jgi:hypothetical protein
VLRLVTADEDFLFFLWNITGAEKLFSDKLYVSNSIVIPIAASTSI